MQPAADFNQMMRDPNPHCYTVFTLQNVCNKLLNTIGCPPAARQVRSCTAPQDLTTFNGICRCGQLDSASTVHLNTRT